MHLVGAWLGWRPLLWLAQHQSVPCDITSVQLSITTRHHTPVCPTVHTLTQQHLTHEKIYLYTHSVLFFGSYIN